MIRKILLFILILFLFYGTKAYAATIVDYVPKNSTPSQEGYAGPVEETKCSAISKPSSICSNGSPVGTTTCSEETPCTGGSTWSKYNLLGCYADTMDPTTFAWLYDYSTLVCSTGDKYNSANPPVLNAGFCSCQVGGPYKTCCSNGRAVDANAFAVDPYEPLEGGCGNNTIVFCGGAGQPACGQAACATPPPIPITCKTDAASAVGCEVGCKFVNGVNMKCHIYNRNSQNVCDTKCPGAWNCVRDEKVCKNTVIPTPQPPGTCFTGQTQVICSAPNVCPAP